MDWITKHTAALVALAGALGAAAGAFGLGSPAIETALQDVGVVVGIVGAVIHSYMQGEHGSAPKDD